MDREREHIIADKTMLQVARATSMVFTPFSIPFLSFLVLFLFSYLRIMPIQYKLIVLGIVYCFTILTPTITIFLFRKINGFARQELSERKKRYSADYHLVCVLPVDDAPAEYTLVYDRDHPRFFGSIYYLHCSEFEMEIE